MLSIPYSLAPGLEASPLLITEPEHLPARGPFLHLSNRPTGPRCLRNPGAAALRDKGRTYEEEGEAKEVGSRMKTLQTKA